MQKTSLFKPSMHWLLVFVPVAFVLRFVPSLRNDTALFIVAGLAIIPLAGLMGHATENLAEKMGHGVGGLLNATFGNAAELIIALVALQKGFIDVVKASITGSIIGNLLLVLGVSVLAGGTKHREMQFNRMVARTSTASLFLAAIGLLIPSVFHSTVASIPGRWTPALEQRLSVAISVVLLGTYLCTLIFSLLTHRHHFKGPEAAPEPEAEGGMWSRGKSLLVLLIATAVVAALSEFLVGSVEAARHNFGVSEVFIGIIVVAVIGNAAEHSTAVWMARKNKMDLSLGIAVGSSLQIALFVAPFLVLISGLLGHPMDLEFSIPETVAVIVAVQVVAQISNDGETNWLEGAQLLSLYLILGILFYFLPSAH